MYHYNGILQFRELKNTIIMGFAIPRIEIHAYLCFCMCFCVFACVFAIFHVYFYYINRKYTCIRTIEFLTLIYFSKFNYCNSILSISSLLLRFNLIKFTLPLHTFTLHSYIHTPITLDLYRLILFTLITFIRRVGKNVK